MEYLAAIQPFCIFSASLHQEANCVRLEEEAERMVEQMKVRLEQAEIDIEKRCRKEFKKQLAAKEAEFKVPSRLTSSGVL